MNIQLNQIHIVLYEKSIQQMFIEQLQRIQALYGTEPMSELMTNFGDRSEFEYLKERTVEMLWECRKEILCGRRVRKAF